MTARNLNPKIPSRSSYCLIAALSCVPVLMIVSFSDFLGIAYANDHVAVAISVSATVLKPIGMRQSTPPKLQNDLNHVSSAEQQSGADKFREGVLPFLKTYCLDCHTGSEAEGNKNLAEFDEQAKVINDLDTWTEIYEALDSDYMPPEGESQPDEREKIAIKSWIESTIANRKLAIPIPPIRRFNRIEYENTVDDLLKFNRKGFYNPARILRSTDYFQPQTGKMPRYVLALSHFTYGHRRRPALPGVTNPPSDPPVEHGFANDHTSLSISPMLLEKYFELSNAIVNSSKFPRTSELWEPMFDFQPWRLILEMKQHAQEQLAEFLPRAFRRPLEPAEYEAFVELFNRELDETGSYQTAMKTTVSAVLVSPGFLFRDDFAQSNDQFKKHPQYAIASRLSYFLWGTMPDKELFDAAKNGRLGKPAELEKQVERMLQDRRIKSLSTDFGMQWLRLSKVNSAMPDDDLFPGYYKNRLAPPGVSMMIEQLLLFETIMVENRSILDFIVADFSYVNRNLMDWYQLKPKQVLGYTPDPDNFEDFFRIKWPNNHRGGVIASGAMLLSTSATTRSSPVYRGTWILDVIFNRPPPAPPAAVPPLDDVTADKATAKNVREKLEQHRLDPACASCHDRIDPLGYALERFDAVGRWRKTYRDGVEIDSAGTVNGYKFNGPSQFKIAIIKDKTKFVRAFVEHMLKYALGRKLEVADQPEIERITEEVIKKNCRFSAVVKQIVLSKQFTTTYNSTETQVSSK